MSAAAQPRPAPPEVTKPPLKPALVDDAEFDFLLACCRRSSLVDHSDRVEELLSRRLNWGRWLSLVDHHCVVPLAYRAVAGVRELLPSEVFLALESRYRDNARKALYFTGELVRIVSHLESAGIESMPYKGPVLSQVLYGEVTQRQFSDLDILVRPDDVSRARAALHRLGYECEIKLTPRREQDHLRAGYEYSFHGKHGRHLLELQWQILPRFYSVGFDVAGLFGRAEEVQLGGHAMPTLTACDLLLVLCAHAAKHVWTQLSWLCDIAQLTETSKLDWNAIRDEAACLGMERILRLNLLLANQLLGSAIPPVIEEQLGQAAEASILADAIRKIIRRSQPYDTESVRYFRLMLRLRERHRDRGLFFARLAFTPGLSEWSAVKLPEFLSPLYGFVRMTRLVGKLGTKRET